MDGKKNAMRSVTVGVTASDDFEDMMNMTNLLAKCTRCNSIIT